MQPHPSTNFEIQKYYQNESKFNDVYLRNNLPKIKDGAYLMNLDEFKSIGTHWIALYVNSNNKRASCNAIYLDSPGVEHISKEIQKFIGNENRMTNFYRIQTYGSIMCEYFFIGFIDFILKGISLLDYSNLFSPNDYEKKNNT